MSVSGEKSAALAHAVRQLDGLNSLLTHAIDGFRIDVQPSDRVSGWSQYRETFENELRSHLMKSLPRLVEQCRKELLSKVVALHAESNDEVKAILAKEMPEYWPETRELADFELVAIGDIFERNDGARHRVTSTSGKSVGEIKLLAGHVARVLRPVTAENEPDVVQAAPSSAQSTAHELPDDATIVTGDVLICHQSIETVGVSSRWRGQTVSRAQRMRPDIEKIVRPELSPAEAMARQLELNSGLLDTLANRLDDEIVDGDDVLLTRLNVAQFMNEVRSPESTEQAVDTGRETAEFEVRGDRPTTPKRKPKDPESDLAYAVENLLVWLGMATADKPLLPSGKDQREEFDQLCFDLREALNRYNANRPSPVDEMIREAFDNRFVELERRYLDEHSLTGPGQSEPALEQSCGADRNNRKSVQANELPVKSQNETAPIVAFAYGIMDRLDLLAREQDSKVEQDADPLLRRYRKGVRDGVRIAAANVEEFAKQSPDLFTKTVSSTSENPSENEGEVDRKIPPPKVHVGKNHAGKTLAEVMASYRLTPDQAARLIDAQSDMVAQGMIENATNNPDGGFVFDLPDGMTWQEFAAQLSDSDMTFVRQVIYVDPEKEEKLVANIKKNLEAWHPKLEPMPKQSLESIQAVNDRVARAMRGYTESRDALGRLVRDAWVAWARRQPIVKDSWTVPYDELSDADKEADRCIGDALWREFLSIRDHRNEELTELIEHGWGVIANAGGGNWDNETADWMQAAELFRAKYHELIGAKKGSNA